jgi:hypothetical protein
LTGNWVAALTEAENSFPLTHPVPITISLWTNSGGEPGTELGSWALTVDQQATNYTVSTPSGPLLVAGDEYWVVAGYSGAQAGWNFLGWSLYSGGTTDGLFQGDSSPTSMSLYTSQNPVLEVQGTPASVFSGAPEPSTIALLCLAFAGILLMRRRDGLDAR